jgi:hypothetical protein
MLVGADLAYRANFVPKFLRSGIIILIWGRPYSALLATLLTSKAYVAEDVPFTWT